MRRVVGGNHVHRSVKKTFDKRLSVLNPPQRRIHLESAVVFKTAVVKTQIVRSRFARHVYAVSLSLSDKSDRLLCGNVANVVFHAGLLGKLEVAFNHFVFACAAYTFVSVKPLKFTFVYVTARCQLSYLAVRRNHLAQRFCLKHCLF